MPKVEPVFYTAIENTRVTFARSYSTTRKSLIVEPSSWRLAGISRISISNQTRSHLPRSSAWCSPCDSSSVSTWPIQIAEGEWTRHTVKKREKRYADLTLRMTFVGRCTSHQIALGAFALCSAVDGTRTRQEQCKGSCGRRRGNRAGVHCRGYWSLIRDCSFYSSRPRAGEPIKESTSALRSLPPFLSVILLSCHSMSYRLQEPLCRRKWLRWVGELRSHWDNSRINF